jgi:hypothetical protein
VTVFILQREVLPVQPNHHMPLTLQDMSDAFAMGVAPIHDQNLIGNHAVTPQALAALGSRHFDRSNRLPDQIQP